MAALCYVAFTFLKIDIPLPTGATAFHLGNTFCVLAALILGGPLGGLAGAIGMSIGDLLNPLYVLTAPKTIILKLGIGLVTGLFAHKVFKIRNLEGKELVIKTTLSATAGMVFNIIGEPLFGYFYYMYILNMPEKASNALVKFNLATTSFNAILAIIIATVIYLAIHKRYKNSKVLEDIGPKYKD